jgi:hypothetical protein
VLNNDIEVLDIEVLDFDIEVTSISKYFDIEAYFDIGGGKVPNAEPAFQDSTRKITIENNKSFARVFSVVEARSYFIVMAFRRVQYDLDVNSG